MATTLFNKTINVDSYGGASNVFKLKHTLKLNSQSNTSSNFTFSGTLSSDYGYSWSGFGSPYPYMKIQYRIKNGDTYGSWTDVSTKNMSSFSSSVTFSKTIDIPHQNDGTLVIQSRLLLRPNNDGFSYLPASTTITSSDITNIPTLHTPPTINGYTIEELNTKLIGIANNVFVENLSIKKFVIDATTYDNATISRYSVLNGTLPYSSETNGVTIDFSQNTLEKDKVDSTKTPILVRVQDSMGSLTYYPSNNVLQANKYDYIPYTLPTLNNTETKVKRNGQTSGKVNLNAKGNFYNSNVGSVTQTLKIYFKYWEKGTDEPTTYNEIPSNNITIEKNTFDITNYELGKDFNYQKAYSVKIKVVDAFYEYEVIKSVPVGESTWTEYKDRVDFKRITIQGVEVTPGGGGGSGTDNYNALTNKPQINGVELRGNKSISDLGIEIPTKTSQLTNDSNFLTAIPSEYITEAELNSKGYLTSVPTEYVTETELNAKGYLTEHQDISGKQDLLVSGTNIKTINNQSLLGSGNITISGGGTADSVDWSNVTNKPTKVSEFTNDSNYQTEEEVSNAIDASIPTTITPSYTTLQSSYTTSTKTYDVSAYAFITIRVKPTDEASFVVTTIPKCIISTTARDYQITDDQNWVSLTLSRENDILSVKCTGRSSSSASIAIWGIKLNLN